MPQTQADQESLIDALVSADVEFIVVGGIAAVLHGAPISTRDLDIVYVDPRIDRSSETADGGAVMGTRSSAHQPEE